MAESPDAPRPRLRSILGYHEGQGGFHFPEPHVLRVVLSADDILMCGSCLEVCERLLHQHGFDPDAPIHWCWDPQTRTCVMTQLQEGTEARDGHHAHNH